MSDVSVAATPSGSTGAGGRPHREPSPPPDTGTASEKPSGGITSMSDAALQRAVQAAVDEVTNVDDRLRVSQTMASLGWGGVLFVDVYTRSRSETLEDLDPTLRKMVAVFTEQPFERITIRWRVSG